MYIHYTYIILYIHAGRKAKFPVPRQVRKGQFFLYAFLNLSWNFRIDSGKHAGKIALS